MSELTESIEGVADVSTAAHHGESTLKLELQKDYHGSENGAVCWLDVCVESGPYKITHTIDSKENAQKIADKLRLAAESLESHREEGESDE